MKHLKAFFILLLTALLFFNLQARTIDLNEAEIVAKNFILTHAVKYNRTLSPEDVRFSDRSVKYSLNMPVLYVLQMNQGFVLVSAYDAYVPVIGYAFDGKFELENAPAHYKAFIQNYIDQIIYLKQNDIPASDEVRAQWESLSQPVFDPSGITRERNVEPLLSCHWDQGSPYNIYCPEDDAGPGGHVWVGCVATAMAQIMYYWRYPETGTGSHCYIPGNSSYGQQCAYYGQTTYNWSGMINGVDNRFPDANALLQYHCAVSVNMDFGPDGSGSQSYLVPGRLNQYFRYNDAVYEERSDYSYSNWVNLLKNDIDAGKPLYYSGYTDDWSGHAFVCDGYEGENFHFNFGWSGSNNGFYTLYDVGGFSNFQACVRNFAPSESSYPYYSSGTKNLAARSGSITDGSGPVENYQNNANAFWIIDPQTIYDSITSITLTFSAFDLAEGDSVIIYDGAATTDPVLGAFSGSNIPPAVTTTQNQMLVEFTTNSGGNSKGFYAEYTSVSPSWCQGLTQLNEPSGTFNDGSGDFYYQSQATCMWRIKPPFANKIKLNFNYFETEAGVDKVTVYDGTSLIGEFSGDQIPDQIEATSGLMFITWNTNISNNYQGWEAFYEVDNVGMNENEAVEGIELYPNPAGETFTLSFESGSKQDIVISLINLTGQEIFSQALNSFAGPYSETFSLDNVSPGIYFLSLKSIHGCSVKKLILK